MRLIVLMLLGVGSTTWDFEKDEVDKPPSAFEFAVTGKVPPGKWIVRKVGENVVLAQVDADKTRGRFAMAVVKGSSFKDLSLSVKGRPVSGEVDQAVGLVWRYKDADNYYVARSNVLESNVRLYRVTAGTRLQLASKDDVKLKAGEWHTLAVEHRGTDIRVLLNGEKLLEAKDGTFPEAGKVGVWTKADAVTEFDDLTAEELK